MHDKIPTKFLIQYTTNFSHNTSKFINFASFFASYLSANHYILLYFFYDSNSMASNVNFYTLLRAWVLDLSTQLINKILPIDLSTNNLAHFSTLLWTLLYPKTTPPSSQ